MRRAPDSAAAYKSAHPGCTNSDASSYAKTSEEKARKNALTKEEYNELCSKEAHLLQGSAPHVLVEDRHVDDHIFPNFPNSGARIGRYINAEHFNDGLFSEVFRALDPDAPPEEQRIVALKVTTPGMMTPPHDSVREARILTAARSEHVIPLVETFQHAGGHLVLVFPYMPYDLKLLLHQGSLTAESRRSILRDLFTGLAHLHSLGMIHRDVKPANILMASPVGPAYLADLGIAWSSSDPASEPADSKILDVGTTCYRPPELLFGAMSYGTKLDMWAAGCVVAQVVCLNRETLFDAGDLGSELALIKSMFQNLGTPDLDVWPEASHLPDWGKMSFTRYPSKSWEKMLPNCEAADRDLVRNLVVYESGRRLSAQEVNFIYHQKLEYLC